VTHLDDLVPGSAGYQGPYLILNAAINLGDGQDLDW
jgi:hypothetical protein